MPSSLPVPSKGALRALRNLALGTSCTVAVSAGLLTEDRRRRINTAREVHSNAKKLKSARQYHNAGGSTIETFEEQALKYRDDAFWLPSNVLQDIGTALHDGRSGIERMGQGIFVPENVPSSSPRGMLKRKLPPIKKLTGFDRVPAIPARNPVSKSPLIDGSQLYNRQSKLVLDVAKLLNKDPPDIGAAASRFLEAFDSPLSTHDIGLGEDVIDSAIRLQNVCRNRGRLDLSDKIFDMTLTHGPVSEQQFNSFVPENTISRLLTRSGPLVTDLDPAKLKKASAIYLTKFTEKPTAMSDGMLALGAKLCAEASRLLMDDLVLQLHSRMEATRGDRPSRSIHHLIMATHRKGLHKRTFRYFQNYYTNTTPDQLQFYNVCGMVIDSMLELQRLDLAEQVLVAAARMAEKQSLQVSSTWILKVLDRDWRSLRDISRTRALFDRVEALVPLAGHPQAIYAAIINCCVEARDEPVARVYYDKLRQSYKHLKYDGRIHGHFALAKAYQRDWPGVLEEFVKAQEASPDDIEQLSFRFTPVLHEYAKSHSLTEVEDYISLFSNRFGLKINLSLMNFMVTAYAKAKEVDCIARWIDCAVADGCVVDASTVNIILRNCHYLWKCSFEQVYQLFLMIRKRGGESTNLLNSNSVTLLRQIAMATSRNPSRMLERLKEFDEHCGDRDGIYRSMSTAFAKDDLAATLKIYELAQAGQVSLEYRHLHIAVKASLRLHEDNVRETARIIKEAQQCDIIIGTAVATVFVHQVTKLFEEGVAVNRLTDLCHSTITAFQETGTEIPLSIVTHTASCLQRRGYNSPAINLWNTMSSRLKISPSSFDLASITTLLKAYIGLQDHAGIRWVIHMLSANNLHPDNHFKLLLNNTRRETTRIIESQPCSNQVHDFLDSILEALAKIKVMRKDARAQQTHVKARTIMIIEKAINDQKVREGGYVRSETEMPGASQAARVEAILADPAYDSDSKGWMSDEDEMIRDVDFSPAKLVGAVHG
ncbi:uncharacterized protein PAC_13815 [Phialocephala subalpina]|uniref:Pentatricopeptide repeat protein n=1 Tax=Phialocephala subalpina TaxID=576137 RepID=A0A1L7XFX7_9HELO|nr:uncharacterized protein PAC_13815 [Phialocephala subalpina]